MKEEWREVPRDPGYFASSMGRVRGKSGRVMSPYVDCHGYKTVTVCHEKQYLRKVHRMVCEAFHGPAPEGSVSLARHLNGKPLDNRPENLTWGTPKENSEDRERHGRTLRGSATPVSKLTEEDVREIRALLPEPLLTRRMIGELFGVSDVTVNHISTGRTWGHVDA